MVSDDGSTDYNPDAIDWVNFTGTSSSQAFSSITGTVDIQVSAVNVSGSPTLEYRKNGGSWTSFTTGSPATFTVVNGDTVEFRATGTSANSADLTVTNETVGGNILDTVRATVP